MYSKIVCNTVFSLYMVEGGECATAGICTSVLQCVAIERDLDHCSMERTQMYFPCSKGVLERKTFILH